MSKKILLSLVLVITLVTILSFMSFAQEVNKDAALDLIVKRGKMLVSTELGNAPWAFQDIKTGEITGFVIELAQMYAKEIGVELEVKTFDWAGVIPALITKKVDMVAAPLSRTMPRSLKLLYCEPFVIDPGVGYALKEKFKDIKDITEFNKKGMTITTPAGSIHEGMARKLFPEAKISPVPTVSDVTAAVQSGRADLGLMSLCCTKAIIKSNPNLRIIPGYTFFDSFACAVRPDSFKLWASFNMFMRMIKLDGRYARLYKKWLGIEWEPNPIETAI